MGGRIVFLLVAAMLLAAFSGPTLSQEKLKIGTSIKVYPVYYLLFGAAVENGYWKENGIDPDWVAFTGTPPFFQAVAAGSIKTGIANGTDAVVGITRGLPVIIIGLLQYRHQFSLWVRADSSLRGPRDMRGAKIGVFRLGNVEHVYTLAIAKALGLEKEIKMVGAGGPAESIAALKVGAVDAVMTSISTMIRAQLKGDVRPVLSNEDYLPKEWIGHVLFSRKDFLKESPDTSARLLTALVKASNFLLDNPEWAVQRVMKEHGLPEAAARALHQSFSYSRDGKMEPKRLENIRSFLIEYGLIGKEKAPPVEEMFTRQFTG